MTSVYDQKTATEMYGREQYAEGKAEGMQQGTIKAVINMFKKGIIKITDAAKELGVSEKEFMKLVKA